MFHDSSFVRSLSFGQMYALLAQLSCIICRHTIFIEKPLHSSFYLTKLRHICKRLILIWDLGLECRYVCATVFFSQNHAIQCSVQYLLPLMACDWPEVCPDSPSEQSEWSVLTVRAEVRVNALHCWSGVMVLYSSHRGWKSCCGWHLLNDGWQRPFWLPSSISVNPALQLAGEWPNYATQGCHIQFGIVGVLVHRGGGAFCVRGTWCPGYKGGWIFMSWDFRWVTC